MDGAIAKVCRHVVEGAPILFAERAGEEGARCEWRFLCGRHADEDAREMPLDEVVRRDPSSVEIVLHPQGTVLERSGAAARWLTEQGPVLLPHRPSRRFPKLEPRYPPRSGEHLDPTDLCLMADVAQSGWHCALPLSAVDGAPAPHAFSVGFFRSWDHPEVALFGLEPEPLRAAMERIADKIQDGRRFEHGDIVDGLVGGREVAFRRIVPRHYGAHLGRAVWYHGGAGFPALQAVWGDEEGYFPWDRWFHRELREFQPVLFESEPA